MSARRYSVDDLISSEFNTPLMEPCEVTTDEVRSVIICEWRDGNGQLWRKQSITETYDLSDTTTTLMYQDEVFYENGQLESRETGTDNGEDATVLVVQYHENGQLKFRGPSSPLTGNGWGEEQEHTGGFETYYENGQLWVKGTMKEGDWDGPYESYYPNGELRSKGMFTAGLSCGDWIIEGEVEFPVDFGSCPPGLEDGN